MHKILVESIYSSTIPDVRSSVVDASPNAAVTVLADRGLIPVEDRLQRMVARSPTQIHGFWKSNLYKPSVCIWCNNCLHICMKYECTLHPFGSAIRTHFQHTVDFKIPVVVHLNKYVCRYRCLLQDQHVYLPNFIK